MNIAAKLLVLTDELLWYYRIIFTAVIPHYFYRYRGVTVNFLPSPRYYREIFPIYRGYRGITAFPITVSLSNPGTSFQQNLSAARMQPPEVCKHIQTRVGNSTGHQRNSFHVIPTLRVTVNSQLASSSYHY